MYKVFFNDSMILIGSEIKKSLNNNISELFEYCDNDIVNHIVSRIEDNQIPLNFGISGDKCSQTWDCFKSCFTEITAAGGLVRNNKGQILFIKRFGRWDLPKGKIEKNENAEETSVREVEEECGITGLKIMQKLDSSFHIYRSPFLPADKNLVLKKTEWFLMEYSGDQIPVPQTEEDIVEVKWFDRKDMDLVRQNTYSSIRDFLDKSLSSI